MKAFEKAIHSAAEGMNVAVDGEGFFVSLSVDPARTDAFLTSLRSAGIVAGKGLHGRVLLSPGLSGWTASDIATIGEAIRDSLEKHAA